MTVCGGPRWQVGYESPRTRDYSSEAALRREVQHGDPCGISWCVARGADLNCVWKDGSGPPLLEAASNGHVLAVKKLIEHRADPEITNAQGFTALMAACGASHDHVVQELIQHSNAATLVRRETKTSKVTALSLAERRLARAKEEQRAAVKAFHQADAAFSQALADARVSDLEQMISYRTTLENDREAADAMLGRCERVMQHIEAVMLRNASAGRAHSRGRGLAGTMDTSLRLSGPVDSAAGTMTILAAARMGADRPSQSTPDLQAEKPKAFDDPSWKHISLAGLHGVESPTSGGGSPGRGEPLKSPTRRTAKEHKASIPTWKSRDVGPQVVPHSAGAVLAEALLAKARARKQKQPQTAPLLLTAVRKASQPPKDKP